MLKDKRMIIFFALILVILAICLVTLMGFGVEINKQVKLFQG